MDPAEVILDARELDPSFTAERHTSRVAVHRLSRLQRRLVAEWVKRDATGHVEEFEATFPLADFQAGVRLEDSESVPAPLEMSAIQRPLDLYLQGADRPADLRLVRWGDRNRVRGRYAWIRGDTLFFGRYESMFTDVERVVLTYTPTPADITSLSAQLVLPSTARETLVAWLGDFFASRSAEAELARERGEFRRDALDAESLWLDEIRMRQGATISRTREVW